jgi:hypothetical protein
MNIWTPADVGSIVSFPRKNETRRDYFRVTGLPECDACYPDRGIGLGTESVQETDGVVDLVPCPKCKGSGNLVDLEALSKEDAAAEQDRQDSMDRLGELCWQYYRQKENLRLDGVMVKR